MSAESKLPVEIRTLQKMQLKGRVLDSFIAHSRDDFFKTMSITVSLKPSYYVYKPYVQMYLTHEYMVRLLAKYSRKFYYCVETTVAGNVHYHIVCQPVNGYETMIKGLRRMGNIKEKVVFDIRGWIDYMFKSDVHDIFYPYYEIDVPSGNIYRLLENNYSRKMRQEFESLKL